MKPILTKYIIFLIDINKAFAIFLDIIIHTLDLPVLVICESKNDSRKRNWITQAFYCLEIEFVEKKLYLQHEFPLHIP